MAEPVTKTPDLTAEPQQVNSKTRDAMPALFLSAVLLISVILALDRV